MLKWMKFPQLVFVFFVAFGVWPDCTKSCILCVEHMYEKATTCSSWFRSTEGMGELQEGRKTSGVADEIAVVRATEWIFTQRF